jgi:hypothetical protein
MSTASDGDGDADTDAFTHVWNAVVECHARCWDRCQGYASLHGSVVHRVTQAPHLVGLL